MNKTLLKSRKVKIICLFMTVILIAGAVGITSKAQTERRASNIKSKGIFDYANGTVVMDSSDLVYLADEIDLLEETYKKETVKALNKMNTYFLLDDYSTTHNPEEDNLASDSAGALTFSSIIDGILESQSIPAEKTYTGTLPGNENEVTGNISAATEESLSLGDAAWVDGELVVGNGGDNSVYYNRGYADGFSKIMDGINIEYVYHTHTGSASIDRSSDDIGCYTNSVCHKHTTDCYSSEYCHGNKKNLGDAGIFDGENQFYYWECLTCGWTGISTNGGHFKPSKLICGKEGQILSYSLGCGKNETTIESATIIFK